MDVSILDWPVDSPDDLVQEEEAEDGGELGEAARHDDGQADETLGGNHGVWRGFPEAGPLVGELRSDHNRDHDTRKDQS